MNINLRLTLTDDERNQLAQRLDGKATKRLLKRRELKDLVDGFLAALLDDRTLTQAAGPAQIPEAYQRRPVAWQQGWLRGWNAAGERLKNN